jgi:hypothetical protein
VYIFFPSPFCKKTLYDDACFLSLRLYGRMNPSLSILIYFLIHPLYLVKGMLIPAGPLSGISEKGWREILPLPPGLSKT